MGFFLLQRTTACSAAIEDGSDTLPPHSPSSLLLCPYPGIQVCDISRIPNAGSLQDPQCTLVESDILGLDYMDAV